MHAKALFPMQHLNPVDASPRFLKPETIRTHYRCHSRQCADILLVDKPELGFVNGIKAETHTKRIKRRVVSRVRANEFFKLVVQQGIVVEGHAFLPGPPNNFFLTAKVLLILLDLGPGVAQADGAVEDWLVY